VVNEVGDEAGAELVEDFDLPILQDSETASVFELYGAYSYDAFVIDRQGLVGFAGTRIYPGDDGDALVEQLLAYR
jgi:hypothetical protein